jgi:hypothetical protein
MPSQIITPPDHIPSRNNILIINAHVDQLTTLVLWLKTVHDSYDIHVWHSHMEDALNWVFNVAQQADVILASDQNSSEIPAEFLDLFQNHIVWFGPGTEFSDVIQYFLSNKELKV